MKAPVQEVEGGLQDVHVSGAAFPTQLAHCKSPQAPSCSPSWVQCTPALTILIDNGLILIRISDVSLSVLGTKLKLSVLGNTAKEEEHSNKPEGKQPTAAAQDKLHKFM